MPEIELGARRAGEDVKDLLARLDEMEGRASRFRVPRFQTWLLYTLRHHVRLVREQLERRA